ncbi:hypothetical protein CRUP_024644, partial [Coryphaenoides rupestris]
MMLSMPAGSGHMGTGLMVTVTSMCSMDLSRFPLDTQTCSLEIESCEWPCVPEFHTTSKLAFYSST